VIEYWKVTKAVHVKLDWEHMVLGVLPRLRFIDRKTYRESRTKEYDEVGVHCMPIAPMSVAPVMDKERMLGRELDA
jgi:hypothetical protein